MEMGGARVNRSSVFLYCLFDESGLTVRPTLAAQHIFHPDLASFLEDGGNF